MRKGIAVTAAVIDKNKTVKYDKVITDMARYALRENVGGKSDFKLARYCLMDALGCAMQAFSTPECIKLIGPQTPGITVANGARVPGTQLQLDPVTAAFSTCCLVRWLDFNDTWSAGGHPSDNLGGLLAMADYLSRTRIVAGKQPLLMRDLLRALIKAYEIQGVLAEGNKIDRPEIAIDSTLLVKIASTAVITAMISSDFDIVCNALSNAFVDGHALNLYRTPAFAGSRKSWAAADATSRAAWLALIASRGEMGYPSALTAKTWGFETVINKGHTFEVPRAFGTHVIDNIQFKIAYPAQRHAQTAAEAAVRLHALIKGRSDEIKQVKIKTHQLAAQMISLTGPLRNFAARDHCLQYIVAVGLLDGNITHESYEDAHAANPRIDALREKMTVDVEPRYTKSYNEQRSNCNAIQVFFKDGTHTDEIEVEYPIGDPVRRKDGLPLLEKKFSGNLALRFPAGQRSRIEALCMNQSALEATPVNEFTDMLAI